MAIHRKDLINQLIEKYNFKSYIEIGVFTGKVFFAIKAKNKIAVDPDFKFSSIKKFSKLFTNVTNWKAKYFKTKSDHFFETNKALLAKTGVDICLVDGMHEFDFALNDVLNVLPYLSENGIIIMHDCNPESEQSSSSFEEWRKNNFSYNWNGDVWKTIVYLQSFHPELSVYTLNDDFGLGIITKKKSTTPALVFKSKEAISSLTYSDLNKNRKQFLNLINIEELNQLFNL